MSKYKNILFYLCVFILSYILINKISLKGDDISHIKNITQNVHSFLDVMSIVKSHYLGWESRCITKTVLFTLLMSPLTLFKIIFALCNTILLYSLDKIFKLHSDAKSLLICIAVIFCFPVQPLLSAGWVSTIASYYFPEVFFLYSFCIYVDLMENNDRSYKYVLFIPTVLYGNDLEQLVVLSLLILPCILYKYKNNKKIFHFVLVHFSICVLMFLKVVLSPGIQKRSIAETITWFPDFISYNLIDKIYLGFNATMSWFYSEASILYLLFSFLIFIAVFTRYKEKTIYQIIALFPLLSTLLYNLKLSNILPALTYRCSFLMSYYGISSFSVFDIKTYIICCCFILSFISIIFSLYIIFEDTKYKVYPLLLFLFGFSTRMMMSFSPTIFASNTRTWSCLLFTLIVLSILLYKQCQTKILTFVICGIGAVSFVINTVWIHAVH